MTSPSAPSRRDLEAIAERVAKRPYWIRRAVAWRRLRTVIDEDARTGDLWQAIVAYQSTDTRGFDETDEGRAAMAALEKRTNAAIDALEKQIRTRAPQLAALEGGDLRRDLIAMLVFDLAIARGDDTATAGRLAIDAARALPRGHFNVTSGGTVRMRRDGTVEVQAPSKKDLRELNEFWDSFRTRNLGGRPPGKEWDREHFVSELRAAYARRSRIYRRPTQKKIAADLNMNEATLREYLADYEVSWPPD